jgi:hypothetical protein
LVEGAINKDPHRDVTIKSTTDQHDESERVENLKGMNKLADAVRQIRTVRGTHQGKARLQEVHLGLTRGVDLPVVNSNDKAEG